MSAHARPSLLLSLLMIVPKKAAAKGDKEKKMKTEITHIEYTAQRAHTHTHTLKWTTTNSDFWRRAYTCNRMKIAWKWFKLFTKINYGYIIFLLLSLLLLRFGWSVVHSFITSMFVYLFVCLFWWIRWVFGVFSKMFPIDLIFLFAVIFYSCVYVFLSGFDVEVMTAHDRKSTSRKIAYLILFRK